MHPNLAPFRQAVEKTLQNENYVNLAEFLAAYPTDTYSELCQRMDKKISPIYMQLLIKELLVEEDQLLLYIEDSLVRCLRELLPNGWSNQDEHAFLKAQAIAKWAANLPNPESKMGKLICGFLNDTAFQGWLPASVSDEILSAALKKYWATK